MTEKQRILRDIAILFELSRYDWLLRANGELSDDRRAKVEANIAGNIPILTELFARLATV